MTACGQKIWPGLNGFGEIAKGFIASHGYDPDEHPAVIADLEDALAEAVEDAGADVLREHGLERENEWAARTPGDAEEATDDL